VPALELCRPVQNTLQAVEYGRGARFHG
jgi:hypothetical protein